MYIKGRARINKINYNLKYDRNFYLWYRYHKLFFGSIIQRGRKLWAFRFLMELKHQLKLRECIDPYLILLTSFTKITPSVILFPLKLGGVIQGVPMPISERKQFTFAIKWIVKLIRDKNRLLTLSTTVDTLVSSIYGKGLSIEKQHSVYKLSSLNRHLVRFLN